MNLLESFNKRRRKKRFLKIFGLWGSHAAVNFVLDSPLAKPWEKDVLCLVTHLQSFETLFTRFTLSEVGLLINRYYELIAEAVMSSEGDVNQFCGPEVIAHYGLIVPIKEASLATLAGAFREIGLTLESEFEVQFGTGLCRGTIIYGSFGSSRRSAFTGFGPSVVCAQRLSLRNSTFNICESANKGVVLAGDDSISVHSHWVPK
jgi:class 3 adenylate cyclase